LRSMRDLHAHSRSHRLTIQYNNGSSIMIDPQLEQWLYLNGYEHFVFVSYPRVEDAAAMRCARSVAKAIREGFADYTPASDCRRAFVDVECIREGEDWERCVRTALCRSVVMVAVCAPIYYRPEHPWCGREYQAMLSLSEIRQVPTVLPILVRRFPNYPLPSA